MSNNPNMNNPNIEAAIHNAMCAMRLAKAPIEDALASLTDKDEAEAAMYSLYNLEREIERLQDAFVTQ